jgi:hypothetical protein
MGVEGVGLVLGQDLDLGVSRVDDVGQDKVNDPVGSPEGYGGLDPVCGQGKESFSLSSGQNDCQDVFPVPVVHRQPPSRSSGIPEKGVVQHAQDSASGRREGKKTPEKEEEGGKKVGCPFFPSLMAKKKSY